MLGIKRSDGVALEESNQEEQQDYISYWFELEEAEDVG